MVNTYKYLSSTRPHIPGSNSAAKETRWTPSAWNRGWGGTKRYMESRFRRNTGNPNFISTSKNPGQNYWRIICYTNILKRLHENVMKDVVVRREQRVQKKNGWKWGYIFHFAYLDWQMSPTLRDYFLEGGWGGSHLFRPEVAKKQ